MEKSIVPSKVSSISLKGANINFDSNAQENLNHFILCITIIVQLLHFYNKLVSFGKEKGAIIVL